MDTTHADLEAGLARNIIFEGNTFNGISQPTINPAVLEFNQSSNASTWTLNVANYLPFGGNARTVSSVVAEGNITNSSNQSVYDFPAVIPNAGSNKNLVQLKWPQSCRGTVLVTSRCDKPV